MKKKFFKKIGLKSPALPRRYKLVLNNLKNIPSLFLGKRRISKGSPLLIFNLCIFAILKRIKYDYFKAHFLAIAACLSMT